MEDLVVTEPETPDPATPGKPPVGARHVGLGVVAVMSLKGTATLTAAYLLPTWPLRFLALAIIIAVGTFGVIKHRRKSKDAGRERSAP
jgi:hypothetical protein